jgi:hypothetical protein
MPRSNGEIGGEPPRRTARLDMALTAPGAAVVQLSYRCRSPDALLPSLRRRTARIPRVSRVINL